MTFFAYYSLTGGGGGGAVDSVNGRSGNVTLTKSDVNLANVDNTSDANKPVSTAQQTALNLKANSSLIGAVSGIAPLGADSKIPSAYLNAITTASSQVVANQAARLAWSAAVVGSVAVQTDTSESYILSALPPATAGNWIKLLFPASVVSVSGKTGTVSLVKADVGLGNVDNTTDTNKPISVAQQAAFDTKASLTGDLGGTLASTSVLKVRGVGIGATAPTAGQVLQATSGTAAAWATLPAAVVINDQAASGYVDIGNTRIQWGYSSTGASGFRTIVLPAQFANTGYSVTLTPDNGTIAAVQLLRSATVGTKTTAQFVGVVASAGDGSSTMNFSWQAIGLKP